MKQYLKLFNPILLSAVLGMPLLLTSCGGDDEDEPKNLIDETPAEREKHFTTFSFSHFEIYGKYLIGFQGWNPSNYVIWGSKDNWFYVFLFQDSRIFNAGWVYANKRELTEEERTSLNLSFDVEIPSNIDRTKEYGVISMSSVTKPVLTDNKIVCNGDLKRGSGTYIWDYEIERSTLSEKRIKSMPISTIEGLYVYNLTNDTISFIHKGFDVAEKWYYTKGSVSITPDLKTESNGTSTSGDVSSNERKVAPGESGYLTSYYIPTGKKMTNASLILDINGKEVRTEPISSVVEIANCAYYCMTVKWDGEKLEWVTNDKQLKQE